LTVSLVAEARHAPLLILKACAEYVRNVEDRRTSKKREREAVRQEIEGYRRFPETNPDPDEWTEVYKEWLAEHPEAQRR
jgi:hypothetical protein